MTIRRGEPWGVEVARPEQLRVAASDASLAALVVADPAGDYSVTAGDIHRMVGGGVGGGGASTMMLRLPFDAFEVRVDGGRPVLAVAHVIARRSWWHGPLLAVMNCGQLGSWDVAPRSHPNDGKLDVVEVAAGYPWRARWQARARLPLGTHVPHPAITVSTVTVGQWSMPRGTRVWIDGIEVGTGTRIDVELLPDHFALYV